ncbi:MAG: ABC transporter substrate-binding protein [Caldilineaceae bacterium]|nr:ABC transporter substrate-binding protein [Caldilineaceae bacterium]
MKDLNVNRRDFLRLSGITSLGMLAAACGTQPIPEATQAGTTAEAGTAAAPAAADVSGLANVPRDRTMILVFGGDGTQFTDVGIANPYATGFTHQIGNNTLWEPLYYYSAFADEFIPWLATAYEYNDDFTELVINIREGVTWSDGTPFTANDVAFTFAMLKAQAPILQYSAEVAAWVSEATAVDDLTVRIVFNEPKPRFMFSHLCFKFDTGIKIVPQHVYEGVEDMTGFFGYDTDTGATVASGPYKIVSWTTQQKIMDLREDWWGATTGFAQLPQVERMVFIPYSDDTRMVQMVVNNEVDSTLDLRATTIGQAVAQNPNVITHTGRELPYGYIDWWPTSMWFNHADGPFTTKEMRWAVSYSINRQQMLDVALEGSGTLTELPFPRYAPLEPFFEAAKPLLEKYPTNEFNLDKAAALMEGQGYAKDSAGFWAKDGERVPASISGWQVFTDIGPVIAEQLRQAGFEAEFVTPADNGTRISDGTQKIWLNGHGGSINDPFDTMDMYTSKFYRPIGEPTSFNSRFQNAEYDAILAQMATMSKDDAAYMDLYLAALEIYLDNLIDAPIQQWMHRIPYNTTYWTGWPTQDDPYVNGAFWALTWPLILQHMTPTA